MVVNPKYKHRNPLIPFPKSLEFLKKERRAFYDSIGIITCPILNDAEIYFTAQGFNHLINESNSTQGDSKARKPTEQYLKLMNLEYAPYIIKECDKLAEIRPIRKKVKGVWKSGYHYELTCVIEKVGEVSVVIEKVGEGNYKFLSVFPMQRRNKRARKRRPATKKRPERRS